MDTPVHPLNDRRTINGWALFDWANSAYALVITVAIFPAYYLTVTADQIQLGPWSISNSGLYSFSISAAYLLLAACSPFLSGIADYGGRKKAFLRFFTTLGALACMSLFFFTGTDEQASSAANQWQTLLGTGAFMLGTIGFAGGLVFYNSYLPDITTEEHYDRVSARGFALGYIGSVLLLLTNLLLITQPQWFGLTDGSLPARISFLMVGIWWLGFAQISFRRLPRDPRHGKESALIQKGIRELQKVWRVVKGEGNIRGFLWAFFFYSAGVQTVLFLAATFAEKELSFETTELIGIILLLQVVAIAGAYLFARVSEWKGNKISLSVMLLIWMGICLVAYFVEEKHQFFAVAGAVGLVMGGIQSLSRSTYSKLLPEETEDTTSFFSFYDILEKVAIVLGTFSFGLIELISGGMRNSILSLTVFFIIGLVLLSTVRIQHSRSKVEK